MEMNLSLEALNNVAEIEIVYRKKATCKMSERPVIQSSRDVYTILKYYWNEDTINLYEEFKVLFVNRGNRVLSIFEVSKGGVTGTVADPRIILATALKIGACMIFLAHNHPSANLKPSRADEELTKKIAEAARFHDIKVLDHIIMSDEGYYSFADEGLM